MKTKNKKATKYTSAEIDSLMSEITPLEMQETKDRMKLAAYIEDLVRAKGWNNSDFAMKVKKKPSVITKWFSGTHNFTMDTLTLISYKLGITVNDLFEREAPKIYVVSRSTVSVKSDSVIAKYNRGSLTFPPNCFSANQYQNTSLNG